jgi:hypothetical protein
MGMHWTELQSVLNAAAKSLGKEPRFLVVPDQRNATMYRIYYGDKRHSIDQSEAERLASESSKFADFVKQFLD